MLAAQSATSHTAFSVVLIVVLIAGLAFFLVVLAIQLTGIADNLDDALESVNTINEHAAEVVPGLEHINRTGGVVAGALPLLYGFAERVLTGVSPSPEREAVAKPASGTRRSRLHDAVGYSSNNHH